MAAEPTQALVNARVWPLGDRLVVQGARIGPPDADGETIDLGGARVLPGLVDAHVHFPSWALGLRELDLFGTTSLGEALERIEAAPKPADGFLRGRGWREEEWPEGERPTLAALDEVTGDVPTALRAHDGHTLWVNSAALRAADAAPAAAEGGPSAAEGGPSAADGGPSAAAGGGLWAAQAGPSGAEPGILREDAAWLFFDTFAAASAQETLEAVRAGLPVAHAAGVTGIHDKDGARGAPEAFAVLRDGGELTLRVWQSVPNADADRGRYVKVFMDGTLGSRTALLLGGGGMRLLEPHAFATVIEEAAAAGMPVAIHAIGDLANREALDGFEATESTWGPLGLRHRIEHAQCIHADDIARYARLGITASVQYSHATSDRELAARLWADRLDRAYPYRQLLDAGVRVAGGSDAPVEALDPLAGLRSAAECGVTEDEAIASFTAAPAWLEGAEDRRGALRPGFDADLVVVDDGGVRATMVGGEWVFGQPRAS
jgi:predicted amidohydrolase YtcJ